MKKQKLYAKGSILIAIVILTSYTTPFSACFSLTSSDGKQRAEHSEEHDAQEFPGNNLMASLEHLKPSPEYNARRFLNYIASCDNRGYGDNLRPEIRKAVEAMLAHDAQSWVNLVVPYWNDRCIATPLSVCVAHELNVVVDMLITQRADIHNSSHQRPLLISACSMEYINGWYYGNIYPPCYPPLYHYKIAPKIAMTHSLLAAKADPNAEDEAGKTPLLLACDAVHPGALEIVKALLNAKADISKKDKKGASVITLAQQHTTTTIPAYLLGYAQRRVKELKKLEAWLLEHSQPNTQTKTTLTDHENKNNTEANQSESTAQTLAELQALGNLTDEERNELLKTMSTRPKQLESSTQNTDQQPESAS